MVADIPPLKLTLPTLLSGISDRRSNLQPVASLPPTVLVRYLRSRNLHDVGDYSRLSSVLWLALEEKGWDISRQDAIDAWNLAVLTPQGEKEDKVC